MIGLCCDLFLGFLFFQQKTAYEMRISDWSSDVCSSDLDQAEKAHDRAISFLKDVSKGLADLGLDATGSPAPESQGARLAGPRSAERRVGKACVSTCRSRCSPYH